MHEQKRLAEWAPKGPPKKPWSQQTIEERVDTAISQWEKALARIDHDGTALNHNAILLKHLSDVMQQKDARIFSLIIKPP